jgi:hypothetical protein
VDASIKSAVSRALNGIDDMGNHKQERNSAVSITSSRQAYL